MHMLTHYTINDTDYFDERQYPLVSREIDGLQNNLRKITSFDKTRIIISLLKNHSIKTEWLDRNKELARLLTSGSLPTSQLESLFSACKHNANFTSGLEAFITGKFA